MGSRTVVINDEDDDDETGTDPLLLRSYHTQTLVGRVWVGTWGPCSGPRGAIESKLELKSEKVIENKVINPK